MKVLFAVSNENISNSIIKKYQQMYKEIISSKNVYYFNAILKELQKDKTYDRIVISEDLEPFANNNYEAIDNFIFEKLDSISDEASTNAGDDIPIILISTDRRTKSESLLIKLFGIGVYSALIGQDRSIEQVCDLINKPRSKKEAKVYYQIDSNDVEYKSENEGYVSEVEIQNILSHYKRLGKNEDKYVESFNSIASQYTDQQLKLIIKFLPLNVKAVLEENCLRYQQIMSFDGVSRKQKYKEDNYQFSTTKKIERAKKQSSTDKLNDTGIKIESIASSTNANRMTKPVVIPSTASTKNMKRPETEKQTKNIQPEVPEFEETQNLNVPEDVNDVEEMNFDNEIQNNEVQNNIPNQFEDLDNIENNVQEPKKGRGRPKKVQTEEQVAMENQPKKGRGRPKKVQEQVNEEEPVDLFSIGEEQEDEDNTLLPGFEQEENQEELFGVLPGFEAYNENEDNNNNQDANNMFSNFEENELEENQEEGPSFNKESQNNYQQYNNEPVDEYEEDNQTTQINQYNKSFNSSNVSNVLSADKKLVAFVGTSKNGTSFLINNLAETFANQGIKTAILDLTKNRNAYYIYTKNEEDLRKTAFECTEKLVQGVAKGISVNKNLDVYTSLPGEDGSINDYENILATLTQNYSLVLLDCDFATDYGYLASAQEIYLVQSMDVLTIQPLTAYLRDLKTKGILEQEKLRIVINKYTKVRSITEKTIIGGMAFYNDPAMSFMTELFNRELVKYCVIPLEIQVYSKYLEGLVNCSISTNGYSKEFIANIRKLANMVYPLVTNNQAYGNNQNSKYGNNKYGNNKYGNTNNSVSNFSNSMNDTLNKMKKNY